MNVQQTIIKGIKEQLFLNNYLVLPGFGGFVLKSSPSHFAGGGAMLLPPSKTVSFNSQLKQNDGLLSLWLQDNLKCTAIEALNHLDDFSEFCTGILHARRRLSLKDIGFFYLDFENNICFEPQQDANFLTASFGLVPVSAEIIEQPVVVKKQPLFVDRQVSGQEIPTVRKNRRRLIAPVLLGLLFFSLLAAFVSTLRMNGPLSASLFGSESNGKYIPFHYPDLSLAYSQDELPAYIIDANGISSIDVGNKQIAVKALPGISVEKTHSEKRVKPVINSRHIHQYEIVLGCFEVPANANRLVKKLTSKNIKAFVAGKNSRGLYVVSHGSFENKNTAAAQLEEIKILIPEAWIRTP